jgi:predicted DCC family thiol-disulfide oxidoreductase YuxK
MNDTPIWRIVVFDGICNLCNGFVQFILRHEKNNELKFVSLQSKSGKALINRYTIDPIKTDSVVFIDGDKVYIKSWAALKIVHFLKFPWNLLSVFTILPPTFRDWIYDRVAKNRYRLFGKRKSCYIPTPELKSRFLED